MTVILYFYRCKLVDNLSQLADKGANDSLILATLYFMLNMENSDVGKGPTASSWLDS
jgi:hypothetical protein